MAVRQYVGARYVPKFYQNSTDPSGTEWEGNRSYEALAVVSYNNDSYTSKIPVPAGIGNPATNPSYWARTGAYNAQVEQYRQQTIQTEQNVTEQINTLKTDTEQSVQQVQEQANEVQSNLTQEIEDRKVADTTLSNAVNTKQANNKNRRYIMIGDSYDSTDRGTTGWSAKVAEYMGLTAGTNYFKSSAPSRGFIGDTVGRPGVDVTFLTLLNNLDNTITDKDSITDIIVAGGSNDMQWAISQYDTLVGAIKTFCATAKEKYPNAKIWVGMCAYNFTTTFANNCVTLIHAYQTCIESNAYYMTGLEYILHNSGIGYGDGVHPNQYGENAIAQGVANILNGVSLNVFYTGGTTVKEMAEGWSITTIAGVPITNNYLFLLVNNNISAIWTNQPLNINATASFTLPANNEAKLIELGELNLTFWQGNTNQSFMTTIPVIINTMDGQRVDGTLTIGIREGKFACLLAQGGSSELANCHNFIISRFNCTASTINN